MSASDRRFAAIINFTFERVFLHFLLLYLIAINSVLEITALRLTNMSAPVVVDYKEDMNLDCQFDMGKEELYAVKWYKDDHEFFRYMPHQQPHIITFPVAGVHLVNESMKCNVSRCQVRLTHLGREHSTGAYRCEVSSEAPTFRLASETHNVTVAALPKGDVIIEGLDASYYTGDLLTAKCTSPAADPPPTITWYINNQPASSAFVRDMKISKPDMEGLVSRSMQIRFYIDRKRYTERTLKLSCVSNFPGIVIQSVNKTIILNNQEAEVVNNQKFYWNNSNSTSDQYYNDNFNLIVTLYTFIIIYKWYVLKLN